MMTQRVGKILNHPKWIPIISLQNQIDSAADQTKTSSKPDCSAASKTSSTLDDSVASKTSLKPDESDETRDLIISDDDSNISESGTNYSVQSLSRELDMYSVCVKKCLQRTCSYTVTMV